LEELDLVRVQEQNVSRIIASKQVVVEGDENDEEKIHSPNKIENYVIYPQNWSDHEHAMHCEVDSKQHNGKDLLKRWLVGIRIYFFIFRLPALSFYLL
jgi:hypothetical protein